MITEKIFERRAEEHPTEFFFFTSLFLFRSVDFLDQDLSNYGSLHRMDRNKTEWNDMEEKVWHYRSKGDIVL